MRIWKSIFVLIAFMMTGCAAGGGVGGEGRSYSPRVVEDGVEFSVYLPRARRVCIAGDFNNWSKLADPLYDEDHDGLWKIVLPLRPGRYEYKYVVDDEKWIPDPGNPHQVDDGFGGKNSVVIVK